MQKPIQTADDERPIRSICTAGDDYVVFTVGAVSGVTAIIAYNENTDLWFAVYKNDWIQARLNSGSVEAVSYGDEPE